MAKSAKIETKITGDSTGLRRELDVSKNEVTKFARDVTARLKAIQAATQSINIIASISGFVGMAKQAISLYKDLKNWINGTGEAAKKAAEEAKQAADKLKEAASKTGFSPAQFAAIQEAAIRANVPAAELNSILEEIVKKGGGLQEVADALGTTADNLERGANAAGRAYTGEREARESAETAAAQAAKADAAGIREMVAQLLDRRADITDVVSDVVRAFADNPNAFGAIMNEVEAEYTRRREQAQREAGMGATAMATGVLGRSRRVEEVAAALEQGFTAESGRRRAQAADKADAERQAEEARRIAEKRAAEGADMSAALGWLTTAPADMVKKALSLLPKGMDAVDKFAREEAKKAEARAKRDEKINELLARKGELVNERDAAIAALTVSAPQAINSLNSIGGLIGSDPTAQNAARMDAERNAKLTAIQKQFEEANTKLQEAVDALLEG